MGEQDDADGPQFRGGVVVGQRIAAAKLARARELRRRQTVEEERLWQALRRPHWTGMPFRRQQVIDGFIADFYCHAARLIVEIDGSVHQRQQGYDAERDQVLAARGLHLLRVANIDVRTDLQGVLARIRAAVAATDTPEDQ